MRRIAPQRVELVPVRERHHRRQVETPAGPRHEALQGFSPLLEGERPHVGLAVGQKVVGADEGREPLLHLCRHGLAVEPLLQVAERAGRAARFPDQQLAVDRPVELHRLDDVGKGLRNVVAGARIKPLQPVFRNRLHADPVPLPLRHELGRVELVEVGVADRMRQHHRPEQRLRGGFRPPGPAFEPGEKRLVGNLEPVPQLLDLGRVDAAHLGQRLPREAR